MISFARKFCIGSPFALPCRMRRARGLPFHAGTLGAFARAVRCALFHALLVLCALLGREFVEHRLRQGVAADLRGVAHFPGAGFDAMAVRRQRRRESSTGHSRKSRVRWSWLPSMVENPLDQSAPSQGSRALPANYLSSLVPCAPNLVSPLSPRRVAPLPSPGFCFHDSPRSPRARQCLDRLRTHANTTRWKYSIVKSRAVTCAMFGHQNSALAGAPGRFRPMGRASA